MSSFPFINSCSQLSSVTKQFFIISFLTSPSGTTFVTDRSRLDHTIEKAIRVMLHANTLCGDVQTTF